MNLNLHAIKHSTVKPKGKEIWQPYFMSITYDSNSTVNKLEVDGALILPPAPSVLCSVSIFKGA